LIGYVCVHIFFLKILLSRRHSITQQEFLAPNQADLEREKWSLIGNPSRWYPTDRKSIRMMSQPFMYSFSGGTKTRRLHLKIAQSNWSDGISLSSSVGVTGLIEVSLFFVRDFCIRE
jgi:hypothetical protein